MKSLGKRLAARMDELKINQPELAKRSGVSQATISQIINGRNQNSRFIIQLAAALRCSPEWLGSGKHPPNGDENVTMSGLIDGLVPQLTWITAGKLCDTDGAFTKEDAEDWLPCPVAYKPEIFALVVAGPSMDDGTVEGYRDGELIFADPTLEAHHKSPVIVRTPDGKTTFKRLIITPEGQHLEALNPNWPERIIPIPKGTRICGVVVFSGKKRR